MHAFIQNAYIKQASMTEDTAHEASRVDIKYLKSSLIVLKDEIASFTNVVLLPSSNYRMREAKDSVS